MQVIIHNKRKSPTRAMLLNAARFYVQLLKLESSTYNVTILSAADMEESIDAPGATTYEGKMIYVYLDHRLKAYSLLTALAHEMVHVKQIARGLLVHKVVRGKEVSFWRGKNYEKTPYLQKPWEIQAFARQELMIRTLEACFLE